LLCGAQRKVERCALADFGLDPNLTAVALNDLLAERQADTGPFVLFTRVEPLKDDEDAILVLALDTNPIIAHRQAHHTVAPFGLDPHARLYTGPLELDGVADQILE
jgi:hypothetical protein